MGETLDGARSVRFGTYASNGIEYTYHLTFAQVPVCGRVYLGVATAFAIGALTHPNMSINDVLQHSRDGVAYVVATARVAALTAVLVSVRFPALTALL